MEIACMENSSAMNTAEQLREYSANRSEDAFRALIDQYVGLVYSSCWRQLRDRHLAEDATQAVFVLLSQKAAALRPSSLSGWLLTTSRYTCARIQKTELRRHRRETAVAMQQIDASDHANSELLGLLDEGISHLRAADREAIALRYLQGQSLGQVGQTLGISEDAARKRVERCVDKLRGFFTRKGITTAALPAILGQCHRSAALGPEVQASITHGILQACHGGAGAAPAVVALAKGTQMMMRLARLKIAFAFSLIVLAISTAGFWSMRQVMANGDAEPVNAATPASVTAAAPVDAQSDDAKYLACRQVLVAIMDGDDSGDAGAIKSELYFSPSADPQLARLTPLVVDIDMAVYRVQRAAVSQFGAHAVGLRYYWSTLVEGLDDLFTRIDRSSARIYGDTVTITPSAPFLIRQGIWPQAPIYFHFTDGVWKLDVGRTFRVQFQFRRRVPIPGETQEQVLVAAESSCVDSLNALASDIEQGKIEDAGELQKRLDGVVIGIAMAYSATNVTIGPR
jgi:RNA polymerase sigma factor (sigma-70 family)